MKARVQAILAKLDAMSLRERVMVFAAIAVVVVALVNTLVWTPLQAKEKRLALEQRRTLGEITATQLDSEQKLNAFAVDPDSGNRQRFQGLEKQREKLNSNLHAQQKNLVAPEKMPKVLESVLQQYPRLRLISLRSINNSGVKPPVREVVTTASLYAKVYAGDAPAPSGPKAPPPPGSLESDGPIFRHGVQVVVEGSYLDLLDYMSALEALPWQLYWGDLQLDVQKYPKAWLSFELYTLSLDRQWINL
jgi:MSHA biogenesis protein MshJ